MPIRAYLVFYRTRLIWSAAIALFVPFVVILFSASEGKPNLRIFWDHFCGCAPGKGDAFALLYSSTFTALVIGVLLGQGNRSGSSYATTGGGVGFQNGIPYTLTRPMRRSVALLAPLTTALFAIAILPALGFAFIFLWMHLVHAPALAFFPQVLRLTPDAAFLPPNASLFSLLVAAHSLSIYLSSISIGLFAYVVFYSQRWMLLSRRLWVRIVAASQSTTLFILPVMSRRISPRVTSWIYLLPPGHRLAWHPSAPLLLAHYLIPSALIFWSWRTLQTAEF